MTDTPMTPDRVRTDALQPGDRVWHPYDMVRFTVDVTPERLDDLGSPLDFHNRATDEFERGMRVTGTDDKGETVLVDTAPSYLWHRDAEQLTVPKGATPAAEVTTPLTPDREQEIRTLDLLELMSDRVAPVISGHLAALLAEVDRLRAEQAENEGVIRALRRHRDTAEARVAELESATGTARAMHRKHADSEHCQADDMTWPCPTVTALSEAETAELTEGPAELDAMRVDHPAPCRVPDSPDCTCPVTEDRGDKMPVLVRKGWDGPLARCSFGRHLAALLHNGRIDTHRMGEGWLNKCPGAGKAPHGDTEGTA